jgi:hypothetical protein
MKLRRPGRAGSVAAAVELALARGELELLSDVFRPGARAGERYTTVNSSPLGA